MSITDFTFIFWFLPISLALYYMVGNRVKEYVLLAISLMFYACGSLSFLLLFIVSVVITVIIGRAISRWREHKIASGILLLCGIIWHISILGYYKYFDFILSTWGIISQNDVTLKELGLPLGISFFTFKSISYMVDLYMDKAQVGGGISHDALYLSFFSQIQSGPLVRYADCRNTGISCGNRHDRFNFFARGANRFLLGFCKKILLANTLSNITTEIFGADLSAISTSYAWLGAVCYSLQLFYDFAGYSDMAIGISEMFGYTCSENFHYPYMTESIAEFWRRWHISLGTWFRDYVYIPLGGSRSERRWRTYLNLLVVWVLTGIWHGASWNFVVWGLGYFGFISMERLTGVPTCLKSKAAKIIYRVITVLVINFQWVIFRMTDLGDGLRFIKRMVCYSADPLLTRRVMFLLSDYGWFIAVAVLFCFPVIPWMESRLSRHNILCRIFEGGMAVAMAFLFLWAVSFVIIGQNNPFVYVNF